MARLLNTGAPIPRNRGRILHRQSIAYRLPPALHRPRSIASRCLLPRRSRPMVRLPRDIQRQLIRRRSIGSRCLLPRRSQAMARLLNTGAPISRNRGQFTASRRLSMDRPIRGRGRPMARCPARTMHRDRSPCGRIGLWPTWGQQFALFFTSAGSPSGTWTETRAASAIPARASRVSHARARRHDHHRHAEYVSLPRARQRQGIALRHWRGAVRGSPGRAPSASPERPSGPIGIRPPR